MAVKINSRLRCQRLPGSNNVRGMYVLTYGLIGIGSSLGFGLIRSSAVASCSWEVGSAARSNTFTITLNPKP